MNVDVRVCNLPGILAGLIVLSVTEVRKFLLSYKELLDYNFPEVFGGLMCIIVIPGYGLVLATMFIT